MKRALIVTVIASVLALPSALPRSVPADIPSGASGSMLEAPSAESGACTVGREPVPVAGAGCCQRQGGVCGCRNGTPKCCNGVIGDGCACRGDSPPA
jgi:hypothetical protein